MLHYFIAFVAAGVYYLAGLKLTALYKEPVKWGLAYGVLVYFFMNYVVLPLSAVPKSPFSFGLLLNGVIGHAIFVGFAICMVRASLRHSEVSLANGRRAW